MAVYTTQDKEYPEDYEIGDWRKESTMNLLREKLDKGSGDVSLGNYTLGRKVAWEYLSYLESGGDFGVEGFMKFEHPREENMKSFFKERFT